MTALDRAVPISHRLPRQSTLCSAARILCREAVEAERDVLALLAKLDPLQLTVASQLPGGVGGRGGQIELVVSDGVEVLLPMAGNTAANAQDWLVWVEHALQLPCVDATLHCAPFVHRLGHFWRVFRSLC